MGCSGSKMEKVFINLISYLLNNPSGIKDAFEKWNEEEWKALICLAEKHNLAGMLFHCIPYIKAENHPSEATQQCMRQLAMQTAAVDIRQQAEKSRILAAFEENHIYCMPVKGCDTKTYYPKSEYRTMGDIDILYKAEQHKLVRETMRQLGYEDYESGLKHDHYFKPPYITIEMHRALVAANTVAEQYYENIWEKAERRDGYHYVYQLPLDEQYIYTMIHLLEHFKEGGIGVRFVMDIYVLLRQNKLNREYVNHIFEQLHVLEFAKHIESLAEWWFAPNFNTMGNDSLLSELAEFVISNGVYGKAEQTKALAIQKSGRIGYIRKVVFPNLASMRTLYPWLEKCSIFLPAAWVVRIVRTVLFRRKKLRTGINTVCYDENESDRELYEFYRRCGVWNSSEDL